MAPITVAVAPVVPVVVPVIGQIVEDVAVDSVVEAAVAARSPYVVDPGHVNLLIGSHLRDGPRSRVPVTAADDSFDYLCDLKRVKVDGPATATRIIRPPDQKQNKVKKAKRKMSVKK